MKRALLVAAAIARLGLAQAPVVSKVEPPDWPTEPAGITLRMLITGANLAGATVHAPFPTSSVSVSASGTHLFVDLSLPPGAAPGRYPLHVTATAGTVDAPFAIVPALPPQGRFQGFSSDDVVYLIMPDRFANGDPSNDDPAPAHGMHDRAKSRYYHGGDFAGIAQRLPYLSNLGITALWLTPIYDNSTHLDRSADPESTGYHGYGAIDFYGVDQHFGTLDQFRQLVDHAHARGIKIIQDEVANHTGPGHPWLHDPPTPTWFNGTAAEHLKNPFRIWTLTDPHANLALRKATLDGWFAGVLPDLNQDDPEVARYLIQNTLWWIGRTGIDGIREDTLPYAPRSFWQKWSAAIKQRYPKFNLVGEVFEPDPAIEAYFQGGRKQAGIDTGVDSLFDFPLHDVIRGAFTGKAHARDLAQMIAHDFLYVDPNRLMTFFDLHDIARFMNEPGSSIDALQRAFTFLMTARGIPLVYYGDEIAMAGGDDPDNRRDFPGGWKEDARNAFEAAGRTPDQQAVFDRLRRLTQLRAQLEPLRRGRTVDLYVDGDVYAFARVSPQASVLAVFNNGDRPASVRIPLEGSGIADGAALRDQLGAAPAVHAAQGAIGVTLRPRSAAIYH
jgi:glycosidase